MCYTTEGDVSVSSEVYSTLPYGTTGYRTDCRDYPFNQVRMCGVECYGSVSSEVFSALS